MFPRGVLYVRRSYETQGRGCCMFGRGRQLMLSAEPLTGNYIDRKSVLASSLMEGVKMHPKFDARVSLSPRMIRCMLGFAK